MAEKLRPFPFDVSAAVEKELNKPKYAAAPVVILARADTREMMVAARVGIGEDFSFSGYLQTKYKGDFKKNLTAGVEAVWTPKF